MTDTRPTDQRRDRRDGLPGAFAQAFAVVGGLAAWGIAVLVAYPMVQIACGLEQRIIVHLVRWTALAIALAATASGFVVSRRASAVEAQGDHPSPKRVERVRFAGFGGMLLSGGGALLLFVEDLATWVIDPCL